MILSSSYDEVLQECCPVKTSQERSRLKGMPQKDLINIRNYDVDILFRRYVRQFAKNGAEILIESIVK